MNIYELLNRFWLENEYDPCSATEIALYFFLLNKANTRRWKMPFRCSTELIRMQLSTTRQNVLKAREGLHKKGFISFTRNRICNLIRQFICCLNCKLSGAIDY